MTTLTYSGELTIVKCWCGIRCAVPDELYREAKANTKQSIYCPVGHTFVYRESEAETLRQQLETANRRADNARERAAALERRLTAAKGQQTKLKNRIAAGVCPCCQRSFIALANHIATRHPEWRPREATS